MELGTKAKSPFGKTQIFGSVVKARVKVRLRQVSRRECKSM